MITKEQARMGRCGARLTVRDLAAKTGLTANTVTRFEIGKNATMATVNLIQRALEDAGVEFLPETDTHGPGVRLKKKGGKDGAV